MQRKVGIDRMKLLKNTKVALIDTSRPSSPTSCVRSKIQSFHKEKEKQKLPSDSSFTPLITNNGLNMGDKSSGHFSTNSHTVSQQDCDSNHGHLSSGCGF